MFSISICFGPAGTVWGLLFKTEESAKNAWGLFNLHREKSIAITDDFGQTLHCPPEAVHGLLLENMRESALAHQARMLHDARIKASTQKAAQTDPQLRAVVAPQGPGIVAPFGAGMAR